MTSSPHMSNMFLGQSLFYCSDSLTGWPLVWTSTCMLNATVPYGERLGGWRGRCRAEWCLCSGTVFFFPWVLTAELTDFHDLTSWHCDVSNWSWWRWCSSLWWSMTHTHTRSHPRTLILTHPLFNFVNVSQSPQKKNTMYGLYWFHIYLFYPSICMKVRTCAFGSTNHTSIQRLNFNSN